MSKKSGTKIIAPPVEWVHPFQSFKTYLIRTFSMEDGDPESDRDAIRQSISTLLHLSGALVDADQRQYGTGEDFHANLDAFAHELVARMKSDVAPDHDGVPIQRALYRVAAEFLAVVNDVKRQQYLAQRRTRIEIPVSDDDMRL